MGDGGVDGVEPYNYAHIWGIWLHGCILQPMVNTL